MIAMRYGTVPVVRETGGLKDSVQPYNKYTGEGSGFSFANFNAHELRYAMEQLLELWSKPRKWQALKKHIMTLDFSWEASAERYKQMYEEVCGR